MPAYRASSSMPENEPRAHEVTPTRILIVAGSEALRSGLRDVLEPTPDLHVVGQISGQALLTLDGEHEPPDLVLIAVDAALEVTPLELVVGCHTRWPTAKVLLLADLTGDAQLTAALAAGAAGLFPLHLEAAALAQAVRAVLAYAVVLHPEAIPVVQPHFVHRPAVHDIPLTDQQRELLRLMAAGSTNAEIAQALTMAKDTATKHVSRLLRKLNARNRTAAVAHALRWGLIE